MELLVIGIIKIIDSLIGTSKAIATYKGRRVLASLLVVLSSLVFFFIIADVLVAGSVTSKMVISLSAGLGAYIGFRIDAKISKDVLYINLVTSDNRMAMKELSDAIRKKGIKIITQDSYGRSLEKTLTATVFCATREESRILDRVLERSRHSFLRERI